MKIKSISIKNYKCIGAEPVILDFSENIIVLIGENNVGKSSIIEALEHFFTGGNSIGADLFHDQKTDEEHAIEIEVVFDSLTEQDKIHQAIQPYIDQDVAGPTWTLRKKYYRQDDKPACDYFAVDPQGEARKNPAGWKSNTDDLFTNEMMQVVKLDAVKNVTEETSAKGKSSFSQIFQMVVSSEIETADQYIALQEALRNYQTIFAEGTKLSAITQLEGDISSKLNRAISATGIISLEPPKLGSAVMPVPQLATNDGRDIDVLPEYQGNGLQRVLAFCLLELLAEKNSPPTKESGPLNLLFIEEPEIYLHPQMERKVADTLYKIAADNQAQVIVATHSPVFINVEDKPKALSMVTREQETNKITVRQTANMFSATTRADQRKRLRMVLSLDPSVNEVFFARRVVLVEGDTEIAAIKMAADLLDIFSSGNQHKRRDTTFVNCRGKWTITTFQEILNNLSIPYVVIHDQDNDDSDSGATGKILELLENDEGRRKMFVSEIEDALGIEDLGRDKPFRAYERVLELHENNELDASLGEYVRFAYGI